MRSVCFALAGISIVAYAFLVIGVFHSTDDPETSVSIGRILEPRSGVLNAAASAHMRDGLRALNDTGVPPRERLERYRHELEAAEQLLARSLRVQPLQPNALIELAQIRWELNAPMTDEELLEQSALLRVASEMATADPQTQLRLGQLLFKVGRQDDAVAFFRRALSLTPEASDDIVEFLSNQLLGKSEILGILPGTPSVVVSLQSAFFEDGAEAAYFDLLGKLLSPASPVIFPRLLRSFGDTCMRLGRFEALRDRMSTLNLLPDARLEAERLRQRSRAFLALKQPKAAIEDARQARLQRPRSAAYIEHEGDVLFATKREDDAIESFRAALRVHAGNPGTIVARARLYRKIAQAEEQGGRPDLAYDSYKRALQLNPGEQMARERVEEMESAAGRSTPR